MIKKLSRWAILAIVGCFAVGLFTTHSALSAELTFCGWGGSSSDSYRAAFLTPFSKKSGVKIIEDKYNGEVALIKAQAETGNVTWDIVAAGSDATVALCEEGLLEKIDYNIVGSRDNFLGGSDHECGTGALLWTTIFGYDKNRTKNGASNWAEFWDVKKFPGARGIRKSPMGNLEFALLADGVPYDKVYELLDTDKGLDRAFKKLDELKPHVKVWWNAGAQPPQLLADGEVVYCTAYSNRLLYANRNDGQNLHISWEGHLYDIEYMVIVKGTKNKDMAMKLLAFSSTVQAQADLANIIGCGPVVKGASDLLLPEVKPNIPSTHLDEGLAWNVEFWAENGEYLKERFNAWLAK
jgi:putative spermidine/putrescine transport system substrate-binding protein